MNNYEIYLTVLSIIVVLKGLISFVYVRLIHKTRFKDRSKDFLPTRLFGFYEDGFWHYFWLSSLWLIIYYVNEIKPL